MNDNHFLDETSSPDPASIKATLGEKYSWYEGVLAAAKGFSADWKHYGKKYGWKLKVHDGAKALLELTIGNAAFRISIAARESEMQALREEPETAAVLAGLLPPGKSKEGWGIRMAIDTADDYGRALLLIEAVAEIRRNG